MGLIYTPSRQSGIYSEYKKCFYYYPFWKQAYPLAFNGLGLDFWNGGLLLPIIIHFYYIAFLLKISPDKGKCYLPTKYMLGHIEVLQYSTLKKYLTTLSGQHFASYPHRLFEF
jgi:hypothetical protein